VTKRTFTKDTIQKIQTFLEEFKKDPTQMVEPLCKQLHLGKSILYDWCREHKIVLADLRSSGPAPTKAPVVVAPKTPEEMLLAVDTLRDAGMRLPDAIKKAKIPELQTLGKYYSYKNKVEGKKRQNYTSGRKPQNGDAPKVRRPRKDKGEEKPSGHTVVEYVEKPAKKKQELLMMMGSPEALLEFVKKMQGV
jgi:hypothetical protein